MGFPYEILDVMNEFSVFCRYLDIPLQHISDNVLKSMKRGSNKQQIYKFLETVRNTVPDIALRTTLISGYPVETRKEHHELVEFVKEMRFERLGVFATNADGMLSLKHAISIPGIILSQFGINTAASSGWAVSITSTLSAINSREASEYLIPL